MDGNTAKLISDMTDEGLFERLATAVLREADPRYAALTHQGVNADGKMVKSAVDGIVHLPDSDPPHLIAVHHATSKVEDLRGSGFMTLQLSRREVRAGNRAGVSELCGFVRIH